MRRLPTRTACFVGWVVWSASGVAAASQSKPCLRLPPMAAAPKIDGVISPGEWDATFHGVGFVRHGRDRVIDRVRAEYWFGYDRGNLYFAIRQETPPSGRIRGRKRASEGMWTDDERTEIVIDPSPGNPDQTRFHFMGNAYDSVKELGHNDRIGGFVPFKGDWVVSNRVEGRWWVQEMATPVDSLGKARLRLGATWGIFIGAMRECMVRAHRRSRNRLAQ